MSNTETKSNLIDTYLKREDWRVNENANSGNPTFSGLMAYLSTTEIAKYTLENIYPPDIANAHRIGDMHIHDLGYGFIPYCCGWSLGKLIKEGINKIPGKASSAPARHLNSLMIQMVNFLGCMQMEAAGAEAFNNVDTHLAPFVKKDNLSFEDVKQYMQQLVFNLNIPSRWGCLSEDAEILTINGFKPYMLVKQGEHIATYNLDRQKIEYHPMHKMNIYEFRGNLVQFKSDTLDILTTQNHRNVVRWAGAFEEEMAYSEFLFNSPFGFSIPYFNHEDDVMKDKIQFTKIGEKNLFKYNGKVWCPTVMNRTFVARREGKIFITGNSQAPFTNFTFDLVCPEDMKNKKAIVAGIEQDYTYGDCQAEMDLINRAFIEIMEEGDSDGQVHTFPIPTYNIDKNFNWDSEIVDKLMAATAKYGIPYFANYVNSGMEASDVRSMCPMTTDTMVLVKSNQNGCRIMEIGDCYGSMKSKNTKYQVWTKEGWKNAKINQFPKTKVYRIKLSNGVELKFGENHLQPIMGGDILKTKYLREDMWLPFNKNAFGTDVGNYELGFAIGTYVGNGSKDEKSIIYSLCDDERGIETKNKIIKFWNSIGFHSTECLGQRHVVFVRINGNPVEIINKYVKGNNALEKSLTRQVFNSSINFKLGLLDGFHSTDGSKYNKRLYTSSQYLRKDITYLLATLGKKYSINYVDTREGRYSTNPNYRIDFPSIDNYKNLYKTDDEYNYYRITEITEYNYMSDYLYCFEVDNDDHLFMLANGLITSNCRLRLDLSELRRKHGGYFGSGDNVGSIGVCTVNLPRIGYTSSTEQELFRQLDNVMDLAKESLDIKRKRCNESLESGLLPYMKRYLENGFNSHFSTIGLVGMNELCLNFLDKNLTHPESIELANKILDHMNARLSKYQEDSPDRILYNLEATPAEGTSYRLAKIDTELYSNIKTANDLETPYYTNSVHLPVNSTTDIFEVLRLSDDLQSKFTSGTVIHLYLGQRVENPQVVKQLIKKIVENYKLPYLSLTPTFSVCPTHKYLDGEQEFCSICGAKTQIFSRVTGYIRPVEAFNLGKKQEFRDRTFYKINEDELNK